MHHLRVALGLAGCLGLLGSTVGFAGPRYSIGDPALERVLRQSGWEVRRGDAEGLFLYRPRPRADQRGVCEAELRLGQDRGLPRGRQRRAPGQTGSDSRGWVGAWNGSRRVDSALSSGADGKSWPDCGLYPSRLRSPLKRCSRNAAGGWIAMPRAGYCCIQVPCWNWRGCHPGCRRPDRPRPRRCRRLAGRSLGGGEDDR
jgi:hypothetical protein